MYESDKDESNIDGGSHDENLAGHTGV